MQNAIKTSFSVIPARESLPRQALSRGRNPLPPPAGEGRMGAAIVGFQNKAYLDSGFLRSDEPFCINLLTRRGQAVLDRKLYEIRDTLYAEFLHQPATVGLDRLGRKSNGCGNLGAGAPLDHQLQHVALARAQAVQRAHAAGTGLQG